MLRVAVSVARKAIATSIVAGAGALSAITLVRAAGRLDLQTQRELGRDIIQEGSHWLNMLRSEPFPACHDCQEYGHGYMVDDELWKLAADNPPQDKPDIGELRFLCLHCLGVRLRRPIIAADLTEAPINDPLRYAWGLRRGGPYSRPDHEHPNTEDTSS